MRVAATALVQTMTGTSPDIDEAAAVEVVRLEAAEPELLLADWLREVHYLCVAERRLVAGVRFLRLSHTLLEAEVRTVPWEPVPGEGTEIKAVTYHDLSLWVRDGVTGAILVCDI